jgi:hypothetical protein
LFPEIISSQLIHGPEKCHTLSQKSAPNPLTSQVYHNKLKNRTPSNKKITETERDIISENIQSKNSTIFAFHITLTNYFIN